MNKTIHELNALITLANDDELIVYDVATGTSKKIKKSDLKNQLASDLIVDAVTDGDMHAVTSNAVFDNCVIKRDVANQTPSTVENDIKALGNELLSLVTSGTRTFSGLFLRLGQTFGSYTLTVRDIGSCTNGYVVIDNEQANAGMYFVTRINNDWIIEKLVTSNGLADSYEQTRYDPTINTTYVKDMSANDGVSVYKTKNGLKVLTGYFEIKADLVGGITDLFTFPEACRQTRPTQLWIQMVSISTGKSYPLLLSGTQLGTWGSFFPSANELLFIPPVTYL